ncbi:MAG: hypothetical protein ACYTGX_09355 [Planctomycetota bacterium]
MLNTLTYTKLARFTAIGALTLALGGLFAAPAAAFGPQEGGGEEEDFYRASDPEDPVVAAKAGRGESFFRGSGGIFTQLNDDRGIDPFDEVQLSLEYLWNAMGSENWFSLDVGLSLDVMAFNWESDTISVAEFQHRSERYAVGVDITSIPAGTTVTAAVLDGDTLLWSLNARAQIDFFLESRWDLSATLAIGGGTATVYGRYDNPGQRIDGTDTVAHWNVAVGGEGGYSFDRIACGLRFEMVSINSTSSSDRLILRSYLKLGAYIGFRF